MPAGTDRMGGDSSAEDSDYDYDVFVIGGGSGGVRAARTAASQGGSCPTKCAHDGCATACNIQSPPKRRSA